MPPEVLSHVRALYLARFRDALASEPNSHVEPALRTANGDLATDGAFALPCRVDLVLRAEGRRVSVDSDRLLSFEPMATSVEDMCVEIEPFAWDNVSVTVSGPSTSNVASVLCQWFEAWFDPEDANPVCEDGWYEVVHFMSDPRTDGERTLATIDLGSATTRTVEDLLSRLQAAGAKRVQLTQPSGSDA